MEDELQKLKKYIDDAEHIVVIQADNPDGDSLGSALGLEEILGSLGKKVDLYCGVDMPGYLRYLPGWDRVQSELPKKFDLSIIVDASTTMLLEKLQQTGEFAWLATKPCLVLDHHASVDHVIEFANVLINRPDLSSAGELIYTIAKQLDWKMSVSAQEYLLTAIMGDTQGLSNQLASPATFRIVADMVEDGVDRISLDDKRREYGKMPAEIFKYKAALIDRTEFHCDKRVALVVVPQNEINEFSPLYNPAPLIQNDMLQTSGVGVAIVLKRYDDGRVTGAIRCNQSAPVGADLAKAMGGGGHVYASGFKDTSGRTFDAVKEHCISTVTELLAKLEDNEAN
jgi:phosphoesterase RecJ-like protein